MTLSHDYETNFWTSNSVGGEPIQDTGVPAPELVSLPTEVKGRLPIENRFTSPFGAGWTLQGLERLHKDPDEALLYTDGNQRVTFEPGDLGITSGNYATMQFLNRHPIRTVFLPPGGPEGGFIRDAAYSSDGTKAYVVEYQRFHIQDTETGVALALIEDPVLQPTGEGFVISPDGSHAFLIISNPSTGNRAIQAVDLVNRLLLNLADLGTPSGAFLAQSPNGEKLYVSLPANQEVLVINPQTLSTVTTIPTPGRTPRNLAVSPDGNFVYVGAGVAFFTVGVIVIDALTEQVVTIFRTFTLTQSGSGVRDILFNHDGTKTYLLIEGTGNNLLSIIDAQSHALIRNLFVNEAWGGSADLERSPTHQNLFYGLGGFFRKNITLFDTDTELFFEDFPGSGGSHFRLHSSILGDGRILYSGEFPGFLVYDPTIPEYRLRRFDGTISRFDADGRLVGKEDRNGNITSYTYTPEGLLANITGPTGDVTAFNYTNGHLLSIQDAAGQITQFDVDMNNDLLSVTDPEGNRTEFVYDAGHLLTEKRDPRNFSTSYFYDAFGSIERVVAPTLDEKLLDPSISDGTINTLLPGIGTPSNPAPVVLPDFFETFTDARGFATRTRTDKFGAPLEITDPLGRITQIERNALGLPTRITQPNGAVVALRYDAFGNLIRSNTSHGGPPFAQTQTNLIYEPKFHQPVQISNVGYVETQIGYDDRGNPIRIKDANKVNIPQHPLGPVPPAGPGSLTEMMYDGRGLLTSVTVGKGSAVENTTTFTYDPVTGNLLSSTDPLGRTTVLTYDAAGNVRSSMDPKGNTTFFEYDALNRLKAVIDPLGGRTEYTYDANGNLTQLRDAKLHTTFFEYDSLNRLTKVTDPLGEFKTFTYDPNGNLIEHRTPNNALIQFAYDAANQLKTKLLPTDLVEYDYDPLGNLTLIKDSDSKLEFRYDGLSRLIESKTGDLLNPSLLQPQTTLGYTYDPLGIGNKTQMTDPLGGITTYFHDRNHRLLTLDQPDPNGFAFFGYDELSRRIDTKKFPGFIQSAFSYDPSSQLLNIHHFKPFVATLQTFGYTYDLNGNRLTKTQDALTSTYTYDDLNRLTDATNPGEGFTYDPVGNRLSSLVNPTWIYDSANRLLDDGTFTYTYDPNGNMTTKTEKANPSNTTTYTYDAENQLISVERGADSVEYAYDGLGRRIQKDVDGQITRYIYDNEDILLEYDGTNTVRARYTHGPGIDEPLVMERDLDLNGSLETQLFYLADGLGSITALTDSAGTIVETYTYDAFGNLTIKDSLGNILPQSAFGNPYTYTGREYDPESGLYYYRRRYYDPRIGRFLQEEPFNTETIISGLLRLRGPIVPDVSNNRILPTQQTEFSIPVSRQTSLNLLYVFSEPQNLNRYLYTRNNPVNYTDVQGNLVDPVTAAWVLLVAVAVGMANFIVQSLTPPKKKPLDYTPDDPSDDYEDSDPPNPRLGGKPQRGPTICPPAPLPR